MRKFLLVLAFALVLGGLLTDTYAAFVAGVAVLVLSTLWRYLGAPAWRWLRAQSG